ncbi:PTS sugar transporter subunit IIA [Corynebacterium hindlerae]|uniref:PTS sugar transporter subunit IIA n=1 Tax=Corynebacterium hindlerae TaxID=699041 RepID=A0A7G5FCF9_9CORY|nr:fructose-specific PTS transporter subunit EIIC [Corynebacterium hindlerae]QMV84300.1 PTS sugar transporter subunit IIA [Corynebacterium hindlerae]
MNQDITTDKPRILAITACPTGIAHTYLAAENLETAANEKGINLKVETHGSIGVENAFTEADIKNADAVLIAADTVIEKDRFVGKRLLAVSVDEAIKHPATLLERTLSAGYWNEGKNVAGENDNASTRDGTSLGRQLYQALMNGVSHMVPFVVTGGLLIAIALSIGGQATAEGYQIPEDSFWFTISSIGALAFSLMVPVLSAFIASGIAGRPGLAPGFITGLIATTGTLYNSEAGAGFIGGIITGFLSGYVALAIKKIPVGKYIAPIMPVIIIPIFTTLVVGLLFVYLLGNPISSLFEALSNWLNSLEGTSVIVLGAILGAMIAFDMGGPFNKTAFLFGGGMIAAGNAAPMGMAAAAIAVPPLAVGAATLIRRDWFSKPERESGIAALFMGFFGITEGAIPIAAARPLHVIPANVIGGAVAGALAGMWGVKDNVMHGGPIVAVLGAVDGVPTFFLSLGAGIAATVAFLLLVMRVSRSKTDSQEQALIDADLVFLDHDAPAGERNDVVRGLVEFAAQQGRIADVEQVVRSALDREAQNSTAVGNAVAIPHARCGGVKVPTLAFARLPEPGTHWSAPDNAPVRLVFLIAVPEDAGKEHLRLLSKLARALMRDDFREALLSASSREQALGQIREVTEFGSVTHPVRH